MQKIVMLTIILPIDFILSRKVNTRTELNALRKSSLTTAWCGVRWWRWYLAAWIAASTPPLIPKPNWVGARRANILDFIMADAGFATSRRRVEPTAIGLIPPPFFSRAINEAPKKARRMDGGVRPSRTKLAKEERAVSSW